MPAPTNTVKVTASSSSATNSAQHVFRRRLEGSCPPAPRTTFSSPRVSCPPAPAESHFTELSDVDHTPPSDRGPGVANLSRRPTRRDQFSGARARSSRRHRIPADDLARASLLTLVPRAGRTRRPPRPGGQPPHPARATTARPSTRTSARSSAHRSGRNADARSRWRRISSTRPPSPGALDEYQIDSAYQGPEALALLRDAHARGRPYALAFVDVRMPPGWDGIETINQLWRVDPDLQVVICTAYSDHSWSEIIGAAWPPPTAC